MKADTLKHPDASIDVADIVHDDDDDDDDDEDEPYEVLSKSRRSKKGEKFKVNHLASFKYVPSAHSEKDYMEYGMDRLLEIDRKRNVLPLPCVLKVGRRSLEAKSRDEFSLDKKGRSEMTIPLDHLVTAEVQRSFSDSGSFKYPNLIFFLATPHLNSVEDEIHIFQGIDCLASDILDEYKFSKKLARAALKLTDSIQTSVETIDSRPPSPPPKTNRPAPPRNHDPRNLTPRSPTPTAEDVAAELTATAEAARGVEAPLDAAAVEAASGYAANAAAANEETAPVKETAPLYAAKEETAPLDAAAVDEASGYAINGDAENAAAANEEKASFKETAPYAAKEETAQLDAATFNASPAKEPSLHNEENDNNINHAAQNGFSHEAIVKIGEPTIEDGSEDEEAIQAADAVADAVSGAAAEAVNGDNGVKVENGEKEADMAELDLCLAGIETFCGGIQENAAAWKERSSVQLSLKKSEKGKSRVSTKEIQTLKKRSQTLKEKTVLPSQQQFIDNFKLYKKSFNIIAKYGERIQQPSGPELVHILFNPLHYTIDASRGVAKTGIPLAIQVEEPLLTEDAKFMLQKNLTPLEKRIWTSMGEAWSLTEEEKVARSRPKQPTPEPDVVADLQPERPLLTASAPTVNAEPVAEPVAAVVAAAVPEVVAAAPEEAEVDLIPPDDINISRENGLIGVNGGATDGVSNGFLPDVNNNENTLERLKKSQDKFAQYAVRKGIPLPSGPELVEILQRRRGVTKTGEPLEEVDLIPPDDISVSSENGDIGVNGGATDGVSNGSLPDVNNSENTLQRQPTITKESDYARIKKLSQENMDGQPLNRFSDSYPLLSCNMDKSSKSSEVDQPVVYEIVKAAEMEEAEETEVAQVIYLEAEANKVDAELASKTFYEIRNDKRLFDGFAVRMNKFEEELKSNRTKRGETTFDRNAKYVQELTVRKSEVLEIVDDTKNWWFVRNWRGEDGYIPGTIVKLLT